MLTLPKWGPLRQSWLSFDGWGGRSKATVGCCYDMQCEFENAVNPWQDSAFRKKRVDQFVQSYLQHPCFLRDPCEQFDKLWRWVSEKEVPEFWEAFARKSGRQLIKSRIDCCSAMRCEFGKALNPWLSKDLKNARINKFVQSYLEHSSFLQRPEYQFYRLKAWVDREEVPEFWEAFARQLYQKVAEQFRSFSVSKPTDEEWKRLVELRDCVVHVLYFAFEHRKQCFQFVRFDTINSDNLRKLFGEEGENRLQARTVSVIPWLRSGGVYCCHDMYREFENAFDPWQDSVSRTKKIDEFFQSYLKHPCFLEGNLGRCWELKQSVDGREVPEFWEAFARQVYQEVGEKLRSFSARKPSYEEWKQLGKLRWLAAELFRFIFEDRRQCFQSVCFDSMITGDVRKLLQGEVFQGENRIQAQTVNIIPSDPKLALFFRMCERPQPLWQSVIEHCYGGVESLKEPIIQFLKTDNPGPFIDLIHRFQDAYEKDNDDDHWKALGWLMAYVCRNEIDCICLDNLRAAIQREPAAAGRIFSSVMNFLGTPESRELPCQKMHEGNIFISALKDVAELINTEAANDLKKKCDREIKIKAKHNWSARGCKRKC